MTTYKRPWWAIARQLPAFKASLQEDHQPTLKKYVILGEPIILSFAWVTYGPLFAVAGVGILAVLAWRLNISNEPMGSRIALACSMLGVPAVLWVIGGFVATKVIQRFLDREIQSKVERVVLIVDTDQQTIKLNQGPLINFADVREFRLISDSGFAYEPEENSNPLVHLIMETTQGQVTLLEKYLGTAQQKQQLISKLEASIAPEEADQT